MKSVDGTEFRILVSKGESYQIEFVNSGYVCRARKHLVRRGQVFDPTSFITERDSWKPHKEVFENNSGIKFESYARRGNKLRVEFPNTGYTAEVFTQNAKNGKVRDPLEKTVYGIGYLGVIDKRKPYWKQASQLWNNMMKRCYSEKDERGYFGEAEVDERWHSLENFIEDISELDGFEGWRDAKETGIPFNLDKDFIKDGNKVYSRFYCCFLPDSYNKSMGKRGK